MFISNPWAAYAGAATVTLLIYYTFIGWKYFGQDIRNLVRGKARVSRNIHSPLPVVDAYESGQAYDEANFEPETYEGQTDWPDEAVFSQVEDLQNHLATEIEEAHQKRYNKQDLIQMLQMILKEYPTLKARPFQYAINNCIDAECAKYGSIHLSEGDKSEVWKVV